MIQTRWIFSFHVDLIHTRLPLLSHTATLHKISDSSKVSRVSEHLKRNNNVCLMPFPDMTLVLQTGHARYVILCFGSYFSVFLHTKNQCSSLSCKPGQNGQSSDKPGQCGQSSGKPGQWTVVRQTRTEWTVVRQTRTVDSRPTNPDRMDRRPANPDRMDRRPANPDRMDRRPVVRQALRAGS